ncbi:MAG TPA: hypothetical protein VFN42_09200 [Acetobacteraceae bacterium]|nr:hypothetical protein [Acetobacteraceae bacterium]
MQGIAIALALHVLAIVLWIGGVGFVTLALFPALRGIPDPRQRLMLFETLEHRFSLVARASILLAGATGLYLLFRLDAWSWFAHAAFWWLDAMVLVWLLFALMLFVLERLLLHRRFRQWAEASPDTAFAAALWFHRLMLALSILTILGAVAGSHGASLFG